MSDQKKWKIEGEAFDRINALIQQRQAIIDESKEKIDEFHKQTWDAILEIIGIENDPKQELVLDTDSSDLGFLIVKEVSDRCDKTLRQILRGVAKY